MPAEPPQSKLKRRASRKDTEEPPLKYDGGQSWEIELKRNRGEISCAECRRLKIKCDKQIPCQSCQRRGCAALCPNGSLSTGQGTRFVLAATEHLHRRISRMSERIRQLEEALGVLHSQQNGPEPHPLLRLDPIGSEDDAIDEKPDLSSVENDAKVSDIMDAFGTLSISTHGISQFFGPTGGPELMLMSEMRRKSRQLSSERALTPDDHSVSSKSPASLNNEQFSFFSRTFPFTPMGSASTVQQLILSHLPAYDRACSLSETYLNRAAWIYQCISRTQLVAEVLPSVYNHVSANDKPGTGTEICPSDLALVFVIFAIACLMEAEPNDAEAEHYNQIARAAACIESVLEKPTLTTVQVLRLMSIYSAMNNCDNGDQESNMEESWSLLSLAAQLAQSVGLHRDSARWGLEDKIVQRRRLVFWDLFVAIIWQSLSTGRPPAFSLQYVDCKFPEPSGDDDSEVDRDLSWIFRFSAECVSEVVAQMLSSKQPSYATISELDRKVREFTIPEAADALVTGTGPIILDEAMTRVQRLHLSILSHVRETILLYIHRSYFAQAILEYPTNPLRSGYAPSFLAAYRASTTILKSVRDQVAVDHVLPSRFGAFWTFAFTAAVVFGTVVTHGPLSPLAAPAMTELELACQLFSKAGPHNYRAATALPILQRLKEKARRALAESQKGDAWLPQTGLDDELSILAGHTRFLPPNIPVLGTTVESREPRPQERGDFADQPHVAASGRYRDPATMASLHPSSAPYDASASPMPAGSSSSWTTPLREPLPDFVALPNHQMQSISRQATRLQSQEDYGAAAPGFWPGQATTRPPPPPTRHVSYHEAQYASNPHDVDHLHHTLVAAPHRPEMYDHAQDGGAQQHPGPMPRDARMTEMWSSFMRETAYDPTTQYRQTQ